MNLDATHDPTRRSWVASAQREGTDFPLQNLPFGRFRPRMRGGPWRIGIAIGDEVLDLRAAAQRCRWPPEAAAWLAPLAAGDLNAFMAFGPAARAGLRHVLFDGLAEGSAQQAALAGCLVAMPDAEMSLPCRIGDYTDFYTGIHHAVAVGALFRPDQPLLPNYKWVPIGYHGRASSIVVDGTPVRRPWGQMRAATADGAPDFGPSRRLDHEVELGFLVGAGNPLGVPIPIGQAEDHLFGVTLLNDWSARDLQAWEYQPLGPFLAKSFATALSPWVVTMEALAPFRAPFVRPAGDPPPLPYLDSDANRASGAFDIVLEAWLQTAAMREAGQPAVRLSSASSAEAGYWTAAQLVAHHTVAGCNLQSGDLLGSGTLSGPAEGQAGSMLELAAGGTRAVVLPDGEARCFLHDGDRLTVRGHCSRAGAARIGFGEVAGTVLAARAA